MSLILDALQEAEQRRSHRRAAPPDEPEADLRSANPSATRRPWHWVVGIALVMGGFGGAGWLFGWATPGAVTASPSALDSTRAEPAAAAAQPPVTDAGAALPLFHPTAPGPLKADEPAVPVGANMSSALSPAPVAASATPTLSPMPASPLTARPVHPATAIPTLTELPSTSRSGIPPLNITGHTYSDNPTLRTLMIDGRMFVEGQAVQPGLRLERIDRDHAVFNFRGTRFAVEH